MVGVPGSSKGCITCRRRKKKCDLRHPRCNRCLDSGKTCGGYGRYPVFLNRTKQGLMKRDPLEEVKMRDEMDVTEGSDLRCQFASRSSNAMATPGSLNIIMQRQLASGQDVTMTSMPLIPRNAQVFEAKLISMFWECYVPSTSGAQVSSPCAWLQESISLVDPPPALRLSLTALAMTRLGWLRQDDAFVRRGRLVYGDALKELQQALTEEHSMCQTETLATCNVLALYELFELTLAPAKGYNSHVEGLTHLFNVRGPDTYRYESPLAQAVLEETRLKAMTLSLLYRKASPLGTPEWCTRPWYQRGKDQDRKDIVQKLYDHGFALGALLEEIDNADLMTKDADIEGIQKYLRRCSAMDAKFNLWYQELVRTSDSPVYRLAPLNDSIELSPTHKYWASLSNADNNDNNNQPFSFPNLKIANNITLYWALKLVVSSTIARISSSPAVSSISTPPLVRTTAQRMLTQHGEVGRLENATNILRSMPFCLRDDMGLLGAQRSLFALRAAFMSLKGTSHAAELDLCAQLYRDLHQRRGLQYAKQVVDMGPKWGVVPELDLSKKPD